MSNSPGGRESPSSSTASSSVGGSVGSGTGSNGCRNSGASFDSGRATGSSTSTTTFHALRYSAGGLSSAESSLGSFRNSYHSSSSSLGSIPSEESIRNFDVKAMLSQGVDDHEILNAWLTGIHLECYYQNFVQAGYDMHTISRMTPEDLIAIGVKPHHRNKIKSEISQLNISDGLPDFIPESLEEWLRLLKLEEYLPRLMDQGYRNVRQVTNITWEDLDEIGNIQKLGHQKKFMLAIKRVGDILSGKRVSLPYQHHHYQNQQGGGNGSPYNTTPVESPQSLQHQRQLHPSPMPYQLHHQQQQHSSSPSGQDPSTPPHPLALPHHIDPRHHFHRNMWPQQQQHQSPQPQAYHHPTAVAVGATNIPSHSHQIQIHNPPEQRLVMNNTATANSNSSHSQVSQVTQPLYHPEVISIRVKNGHGHGGNSLDSPPEEPIYGTSSFMKNATNTTTPPQPHPSSWLSNRSPGSFIKSYEEGETSPATTPVNSNGCIPNGNGSNLSWTLPRLQKHKPINKVMGGGVMSNSSCDSSSAYPINGPFVPQHVTGPQAPAPPSISKEQLYGSITPKVQPPPPPRRSTSAPGGSGTAATNNDEDNLPLPPPPPTAEEAEASVPQKMFGMSSSYYSGQKSGSNSNSNIGYQLPKQMNGGRPTSTPKSSDLSPSGLSGCLSDHSDSEYPNGFLTRGVRRNGSDASFKSNSSNESESIPFANDNAGTIKQQKSSQRSALNSTSNSTEESGDVLSDIGTMLADLTIQLDAMLEMEKN